MNARSKVVNIVVAGLGGQGVLTAADIVADAAFRQGFDVKKAEVHGMSQRGGSVACDVRYGDRVWSPMVPPGEADYLVVLAAEEVDANRSKLRPGGILIEPCGLVDKSVANRRSVNIALVGVLSRHLQIPEAAWDDAIRAHLREELQAANVAAFQTGREISL